MKKTSHQAMTSMIKWLAFVLTFATNVATAKATVLIPTDDGTMSEASTVTLGHQWSLTPRLMRDTVTNASYTANAVVIRFRVNPTDIAKSAELLLDLAVFSEAVSCDFRLWGLGDAAGLRQYWNANTAVWSAYDGIINNSETGINTSAGGVFDGDPSTSVKDPLATITLTQADVGKTVKFSSAALVNFINADSDGLITFILTRTLRSNTFETTFAARESSAFSPPRLIVDANTSLSAAADTYARYGDSTVHGTETKMPVKNCGENCPNARRGVIRFNVPAEIDVERAAITFDVESYEQPSGTMPEASSFLVYGIRENSPAENFNQTTANDATFSYELDGSGDGIVNNHLESLGKFWVKSSDVGMRVSFTSEALVDFISTDTNGRVSFVITRTQNTPGLNINFATKEHTTLRGPTLSFTQAMSDVATPTMKFVFKDIDGDGDKEQLLVVQMPGGDGFVVTDPFVIAETLRIAGYDFGSGTDFWDTLSQSQQAGLLATVSDLVPNVGTQVNAHELNTAREDLPEGRTYEVLTFKGDFDTEGNNGMTVQTSVFSSTSQNALGYSTVEMGSGAAGAMFTSSGLAFGAESNAFVITQGVGDPTGSTASVSLSAGVGFYTQMKYGQDGQYGASIPLVVVPVGISVYVKGSDAANAWNTVKDWTLTWGVPLYDSTENVANWGIDWSHDVCVVSVNAVNESAFKVAHSGGVAVVWTKDAGREATVWLYGTSSTVGSKVDDAVGTIGNSLVSSSSNAAEELSDWSSTAGSTVVASYDTSAGWVEGSASTLSDLANDVANDAGEAVDEAVDSVRCNALWCF